MSLKTTLSNLVDKVLDNLILKVISLFIAVLLWFYIKGITNTEYDFYLPLNYVGLPFDKVIVNQSSLPKYALVKVKGERERVSKLLELPKNSIYALVDLSKINVKNLYKVEVVLPEDMKSFDVQVYPSELFVDIDDIVETNLAIVVKNSKDYVVIPNVVQVRTISRNLKSMTNLELEVDVNKKFDKLSLQNYPFVTFIPDFVIVSNTNN